MKHYPHYGEQGFYMEYWFLLETPHTAEDARRQLCALHEIRTNRAEYNSFTGGHISKRHNRLLKQYRAFCAMEV